MCKAVRSRENLVHTQHAMMQLAKTSRHTVSPANPQRDVITLKPSRRRVVIQAKAAVKDQLDAYEKAFHNRKQRKIMLDHASQLEAITASLKHLEKLDVLSADLKLWVTIIRILTRK